MIRDQIIGRIARFSTTLAASAVVIATFSSPASGLSFGTPTYYDYGELQGIAVADMNRDGWGDVVGTSWSNPARVSTIFGVGNGELGQRADVSVRLEPRSLTIADLNNDDKPDVLTAHSQLDVVTVLLGRSDGSLGPPTEFAVGDLPTWVAVGDVDGDGDGDLVTANMESSTVSVLFGTGTGSFGSRQDFAVDSPFSVALGDVNDDGRLDIATSNLGFGTVSVLLGTGTGSFGPPTKFSIGVDPQSPEGKEPSEVVLADIENDGKLDIITRNGPSATISVLRGSGTGSFGAPTDYRVGEPGDLAVGDLDGDGWLDVVVSNSAAEIVVLRGTGGGAFGDRVVLSTEERGPARFVALGDLNGDQRADLAAAIGGRGSASPIATFLNTSPAPPRTKRQCKKGGWRNFPSFKNQGQCIRFVTKQKTHGRSKRPSTSG